MMTPQFSSRLLRALCGGILLLSVSGAHAWDFAGWAAGTVASVSTVASTAVNGSLKTVQQAASSVTAVATTAASQTAAVVTQAVKSVVVTASTTASQTVSAVVKVSGTVLNYLPSLISDGLNPLGWVATTMNALGNSQQTVTGAANTIVQTAANQTNQTAATAVKATTSTISTTLTESGKTLAQLASSLVSTMTAAMAVVLPDDPLILGADDSILPAHSTCGDAVAEAVQSCSSSIAMSGAVQRQSAPGSLYWNHYPVLMIEGLGHADLVTDASSDHAAVPVVSSGTVTGLRVAFNSTTRNEHNWWDVFSGGKQYIEVSGSRGQGITRVALNGLHY